MGMLSWIVFGLLAGLVARWIMPGKGPQGCVVTVLLGIVGAFVGGYIGTRLGFGTVTGFNLHSFLIAVGGAVLVLVIYHLITGRRT
jgi:uncharacterized membrane protein YeaQ/YmgE (transglycosylase-associated protein family)